MTAMKHSEHKLRKSMHGALSSLVAPIVVGGIITSLVCSSIIPFAACIIVVWAFSKIFENQSQ